MLSPLSLELAGLQRVFADHLPVLLASPSNTQMPMFVLPLTVATSKRSPALLSTWLVFQRLHYHRQTVETYNVTVGEQCMPPPAAFHQFPSLPSAASRDPALALSWKLMV